MSELIIKPFREAHLDIFDVVESHREQTRRCAEQLTYLGKIFQFASHIIDGRIIFIGGYYIVSPGVIEIFMHPSVYFKRYKYSSFKYINWWLTYMAAEHQVRRIQTWGECTPEQEFLLERLGFVKEGVLNSYLENSFPVCIWAKIYKKEVS